MRDNDKLRVHIINVGHGDSILVEFPDDVDGQNRKPRFGLVDAGGTKDSFKDKTLNYLQAFLDCRFEDGARGDYIFEFMCLTHPHKDHYLGMLTVLNSQDFKPKQFWDCGFRYNTLGYLRILDFLDQHREIQFLRLTSGAEFHFDGVEVVALAPSIDLRNRYDTYGVELNDASIVLRLSHGKGVAVLAGDAHFDSWGKICEEFPRKKHLTYPPVGSSGKPDMRDSNHPDLVFVSQENQLNCQLLKVAHHGSKRGTSFEYVEVLSPTDFAITCDADTEYSGNWAGKFPHPITRRIIGEQTDFSSTTPDQIPDIQQLANEVGTTAHHGNMIYMISTGGNVKRRSFGDGSTLGSVDKAEFCKALDALA